MSSFEWMELQTLTSEIAAARGRLTAARSRKDHRGVRALEEEIAAAESRRDRLLAHISTNLAGQHESAAPPPATAGSEPSPASPAVGEAVRQRAAAEKDHDGSAERAVAIAADAPVSGAEADRAEGGVMAWDRLTPSDIEGAKHELGVRRAEMLARHAEELKELEAERAELVTLEQAIGAFVRKFSLPSSEVVQLEEKREVRQHARA